MLTNEVNQYVRYDMNENERRASIYFIAMQKAASPRRYVECKEAYLFWRAANEMGKAFAIKHFAFSSFSF